MPTPMPPWTTGRESVRFLRTRGGSGTARASYHDARYIRLNNTPNHTALNTKLAALEGGEAAIVTASGMAAVTTTLLTVLATGDRVLAQRGVYGGTHGFLTQECAAFGIGVDWIDATDRGGWEHACGPRTRARGGFGAARGYSSSSWPKRAWTRARSPGRRNTWT